MLLAGLILCSTVVSNESATGRVTGISDMWCVVLYQGTTSETSRSLLNYRSPSHSAQPSSHAPRREPVPQPRPEYCSPRRTPSDATRHLLNRTEPSRPTPTDSTP